MESFSGAMVIKQRVFFISLIALLVVLGIGWLPADEIQGAFVEHIAPAATHIVTSTADSGPGTLREALQNADTNDVILFSVAVFPPSNPATIFLTTELPVITTDGLLVNASDAGVIIDGSNLPAWNNCLIVGNAANVQIRGFQIVDCPGNGIEIRSGAANAIIGGDRTIGAGPVGQGNLLARNNYGLFARGPNIQGIVIKGNLVGTNLAGTSADANIHAGLTVTGTSNILIGGNVAGEQNLVSGNGIFGIEALRSVSITIEGNYVGTNLAGTEVIGNVDTGVKIVDSADVWLKANLISGNGSNGAFFDRVTHSVVQGNTIGTNLAGTVSLSNGQHGLGIRGSDFTIGGPNTGDGNLISGNGGWAALVLYGNGNTHAVIQGNQVGTNRTGDAALRNVGNGIYITGTNVLLGGTNPSEGNLISGNGSHGVYIESGAFYPFTATILNNTVGTNLAGTAVITNSDNGIALKGFQEAVVQNNLLSGNGMWAGISLEGSTFVTTYVTLQGNLVGTNRAGDAALRNLGSGIYIDASNALIGGSEPMDRNLISGNGGHGIHIENKASKQITATILNNLIGIDLAGTTTFTNTYNGVLGTGLSRGYIQGNVIGGSGEAGISLSGLGNAQAIIQGNRIGVNPDGDVPLRNKGAGIYANGMSVFVGGYDPDERNVISGNGGTGLQIEASVSGQFTATVLNNLIGTNLAGTTVITNTYNGIFATGLRQILIQGNLLSGNGENGINLDGKSIMTATICGNVIGPNLEGNQKLGNDGNGIYAQGANLIIGERSSCIGNLVSGNRYTAMSLHGGDNLFAIIQGNKIGTDASGQSLIGQGSDGVWSERLNLTFGGPDTEDGNLVSGSTHTGLVITGTSYALVQNNKLGTSVDGTIAIGNGWAGIVLNRTQNAEIRDNQSSGNGTDGIALETGSTGNSIHNNYLGTNASGTASLGNNQRGLAAWGGANHNLIFNNLISGNEYGIVLHDSGTDHNEIHSNIIGTDFSGTTRLPNTRTGVVINTGAYNIVGGDTVDKRNLISGNNEFGITLSENAANNVIIGNFIGVNISATNAITNGYAGVGIFNGASYNRIGGITAEERNIISGNDDGGINVGGYHNEVLGNYIGTDRSGSVVIGNGGDGVNLHNTLESPGGQNVIKNNLISGNNGSGITIISSDNIIHGNYIGVDVTGSTRFANLNHGIYVAGSRNQIGGTTAVQRNIVSGSGLSGITIGVDAEWPHDNVVQGNYIGTDASGEYAIGNTWSGIYVSGVGHIIGGALAGQGNLVSGNNENGIVIGDGISSTYNLIQGNYVGTDSIGVNPIPNGDTGIALWDGVAYNTVGGETPEAGNLVAFNHDLGIAKWEDGLGNRIANNVIHHNKSVGLRITVNTSLSHNNVYDNGVDRIEIPAGTIVESDQRWGPQGKADTYFIHYTCSTCELEVASGRTLMIEPGVKIRMDYNRSILVHGTLNAEGTQEKPVRFGGPRDSIWAGDWQGIIFAPGSSGQMQYADVSFAKTGLTIQGTVAVQNSTIAGNLYSGIKISDSGTVSLHSNSFGGNRQYDIWNQTAALVNAQESWWGQSSGPTPDKLQGNVDTSNWQTAETRNDSWYNAEILNPGIVHQFKISQYDDLDWFRVPVLDGNQVISVTMEGLPADYDLFLFSHLGGDPNYVEDIARIMWVDKLKHSGELESIARIMWVGQLFDNRGEKFDTGQLLRASTNSGTTPESISFYMGNQVGWYYLLIAGNNGANQTNSPYSLTINTHYAPVSSPNYIIPQFPPLTSTYTNTTLIVTNRDRLVSFYGEPQTMQLMEKVTELASAPGVNGVIVDLADYPVVQSQYISWTESITSVYKANLVAATIKGLLSAVRTSYPELQYIVIVGNDDIVPHWRVFDEAPVANEREYNPHTVITSSIGTATRLGYFLTDDFYADYAPTTWRGRELYLPYYSIGRLVEEPDDIIAVIDAYLDSPTLVVSDALVTGYDFLTDLAERTSSDLGAVPTITTLISNYWTAQDLRTAWFPDAPDFNAINAHFTHWEAIPANFGSDHFKPGDIQSDLINSDGSFVYSVGCHAGLCMPDRQSVTEYKLDFCQALADKGVTYVANTGYGYGDVESIGYSELLSLLFLRNLKSGLSVGDALSRAKIDYYRGSAAHSFSPYDEKVLNEITLYGLPMYEVQLPDGANRLNALSEPPEVCNISDPSSSYGLHTQMINCTLPFTMPTTTDSGSFYTIYGETEINMGEPVQPRTSVSIPGMAGSLLPPGMVAHGVILEGGQYQTIYNFDPVVARMITDSVHSTLNEPSFDFQTWLPSTWDVINSVRTKEGLSQKLVLVPAQYYATNTTSGIERVFREMTYTVYYSENSDDMPPNIWKVVGWNRGTFIDFEVEATDFSGIARVVVAYTTDDGIWHTIDLVRNAADPNKWTGSLSGLFLENVKVEFFVQVLDLAGNVAVADNKGGYFETVHSIYLPLVTRNY